MLITIMRKKQVKMTQIFGMIIVQKADFLTLSPIFQYLFSFAVSVMI